MSPGPRTPREEWPELPLEEWQDTYATLHRWSQVVGKIRMTKAPVVNHWWHVALHLTSRGLTTTPTPDDRRTFEIAFDFLDHRMDVTTSDDQRRVVPLEPMSVADFHHVTMDALASLGIEARIWPVPVEIPDETTPFTEDRAHASYEPEWATRFWRALAQGDRVVKSFRNDFLGKTSPVHFFWGGFDLAYTRFSGREAPPHPGVPGVADSITREGYSHEVWSAGWWPGAGLGEPAFYAYAYPEPEGFGEAAVRPDAAYYSDDLREWIVPYEAVRAAGDPDAELLAFLRSSYAAAADLGGWDRRSLERRGGSG